jgi:CTP synthase (UTP-ammonia lyase)
MDAILVPGGFGKRGVEGQDQGRCASRARRAFRTSGSALACSSP